MKVISSFSDCSPVEGWLKCLKLVGIGWKPISVSVEVTWAFHKQKDSDMTCGISCWIIKTVILHSYLKAWRENISDRNSCLWKSTAMTHSRANSTTDLNRSYLPSSYSMCHAVSGDKFLLPSHWLVECVPNNHSKDMKGNKRVCHK